MKTNGSKNKQEKDFWDLGDGTKIRIKDISDSDLQDIIQQMNQKRESLQQELPYPCFQGEMAQEHAEEEYNFLMAAKTEDLWPIYNSLAKEAIRRGMYDSNNQLKPIPKVITYSPHVIVDLSKVR